MGSARGPLSCILRVDFEKVLIMIRRSLLTAFITACIYTTLSADNYPRNAGIDIIHYIFDVTLNDDNQVIAGNANVTIRFVEPNVTGFHLDLCNKHRIDAEEGTVDRGMDVFSVMQDRETLSFIHENNRLLVEMASPSKTGESRTYSIAYSGYEKIDFIGKSITVTSSDGPNVTIIDGGYPVHPDLGSAVLFRSQEDPDSVLEGFTLTNGSGHPGSSYAGGGICCTDG